MAASIKYRPFASSDFESKIELFRLCFSESQVSRDEIAEEHYWKFLSLLEQNSSYQFVAEKDGQLVGYYAAIPLVYKVFGQELRVGLVVDVMTHPHYQRQGVFTSLGRHSCDSLKALSIDFTTGYPIRPQVIPGHLKVGWKVLFDLPTYMYFLSTRSALRSKNLTFLFPIVQPGFKLLSWLTGLFLSLKKGNVHTEVIESEQLTNDGEFLSFQKKWLKTQKIACLRTPELWAWRVSRPNKKYYSLLAKTEKGELVAHVLVSPTYLKGVSTLSLIDFQWLAPEINLFIHARLRKLAHQLDCETISCMATKPLARLMSLPQAGFIKTPYKFDFIINNLSDRLSPEALDNEQDWYLTWFDTDSV